MLPRPIDESSVLPWETEFEPEAASPDLPGISVVMPIYNAGAFLEKTLRSLLCNDLTGIEVIVMDGNSTDNTAEILEYYADHITVAVSEPDRGQSDAINKGFDRATKDILTWLNGDDLYLPNTLNKVRNEFMKKPGTDVVVGNAYMTELDLTPIRHFRFSRETLRFDHLIDYAPNHLVQPSVFFTRKAWDECGPVSEDLHYAMDADLFLSMAKAFDFEPLDVDVAYSVYHEECKTRDKRAESITELSLIEAKHGGLAEARKTLDILVGMYNQASGRAGPEPDSEKTKRVCEACHGLEQKIEAMEKDREYNMKALVQLSRGLS